MSGLRFDDLVLPDDSIQRNIFQQVWHECDWYLPASSLNWVQDRLSTQIWLHWTDSDRYEWSTPDGICTSVNWSRDELEHEFGVHSGNHRHVSDANLKGEMRMAIEEYKLPYQTSISWFTLRIRPCPIGRITIFDDAVVKNWIRPSCCSWWSVKASLTCTCLHRRR